MPLALSRAPKGAKTSKPAQQSGEGAAASAAAVQRMPAYAHGLDASPGLSLLSGGAVQAKTVPPAERRPEEEESAGPEPVQRQAEGAEEDEEFLPGEEPDAVQAEFAAGEGEGGTPDGGDSATAHNAPAGGGRADSSGGDSRTDSHVHDAARHGLSGAARPLPELSRIQKSFGDYDVSGVRVQVGGPAARASEDLGALAYTSGSRIAFKQEPGLRLAAHEAAHVVQQRRGVQLDGGVGESGDAYERQADRAADAVVAGQSAEAVLDEKPQGAEGSGAVQMKCACGGGGCASCAQEGEKKEETVRVEEGGSVQMEEDEPLAVEEEDEPVQMQLEVTTERRRPEGLARTGGGGGEEPGAAPGAGAAEEEAASAVEGEGAEEETAADEAESAAEEAKGEAEGSVEEQSAALEETPAVTEDAAAEVTEPATPEERSQREAVEEGEEERERDEEEEEEEEQPQATPEEVARPGELPIQRKQCDPPPPPPDREMKEGEEPPPEPPPGKVEEEVKADGPTAEEQTQGCGADQMAATLESAAPAEEAAAPAEEAASTEPAATEAAAEGGGGEAPAADAAAGGGGGPGGGPAEAAGAALESNVGMAEAGRAEAVASYESSSAALDSATGGVARLSSGVSFPKVKGGTDADEKRRADATRALEGFLSAGSERISDALSFAQGVIPERAGAAAQAAKAQIEGAAAASSAALAARIAQARADAAAQAAALAAQINSAHDATVASIEAETNSALETLDADYNAAANRIPGIVAEQMWSLHDVYAEGDRRYREVGRTIGEEATARGEYYAKHYDGCHINKKDSFWDGYLTDRRADARMKAARDVAKGYKESLEKEANKQADEGAKGLACDQEAVQRSAAATVETLDSQYQSAVEALLSAQAQAVASAGTTRDQLLASAEQALASTLAGLDAQEQSQLRTIADTAYMQVVTVEQAAHMAAASLQQNILQAADALGGALRAVASALTSQPAPDPGVLGGALARGRAQMDAGLGSLYERIEGGLAGVEGQIASHGGQSAEAVNGVARDGIAQADEAMAGFGQTASTLESSAADTFAQMTEGHISMALGTTASASAGFEQQVEGLKQSYESLNSGVAARFEQAATGLEAGLRDSLKGMDSGKDSIPKYADEAASKEAPAWKSVVKWVLIIAIIVVVALVIGPAVIGAVGAWAGSAFAGAVIGGALVGAATGAAIQMLNNWETNTAWHEGVGKAALMGAIGGAIGGGAGFLIGKQVASAALQFGLSKVTTKVVEFGANLASDALLEIGTQLVTTGEVNWSDFGTSMLMSIATAGFGEIPAVKNVQARVSTGADSFGAGLPGARKPKVAAPDVHAGGAKPSAEAEGPGPRPAPEPEAAAPRTEVEPEAGAPRPEAEGGTPRPEGEPAPAPRPDEEAGTPRSQTEPRPEAEVDADAKSRAEAGEKPRPGTGDTPRLDAEPDMPANRRTDAELGEAAAGVKVGDSEHGVVPRNWLGEVKLFACSPSCGPITGKLEAMLKSPSITPELKTKLEALKAKVEAVEADIKAGKVTSEEIVARNNAIADELHAIGKTHPELGPKLDAEAEGAETGPDAATKQKHADEWGVNPETGKVDPNAKMGGLTKAEVEARAKELFDQGAQPHPSQPDAVRRRLRHMHERAPDPPMGFDKWAESGYRANVNRDVSAPAERGALEALGATPNNPTGEGQTYTSREWVDKETGQPVERGDPRGHMREETTRPDGTRPNKRGGTDVIEHKHLTGDSDVYNDTQQLRGQRKMAKKLKGDHELVLSSDRDYKPNGDPPVRPSGPLGESGSTIYYYNPKTNKVTHKWDPSAGRWVKAD